MKVLTFNGLRFLALSIDSGQLSDGVHGFYKASKNGIHLYKPDRSLEAYLVRNNRQGYFVVTATTQKDGRPRYLYSTCSTTEKWLCIENVGILGVEDLVRGAQIDEEPGIEWTHDPRGGCMAAVAIG